MIKPALLNTLEIAHSFLGRVDERIGRAGVVAADSFTLLPVTDRLAQASRQVREYGRHRALARALDEIVVDLGRATEAVRAARGPTHDFVRLPVSARDSISGAHALLHDGATELLGDARGNEVLSAAWRAAVEGRFPRERPAAEMARVERSLRDGAVSGELAAFQGPTSGRLSIVEVTHPDDVPRQAVVRAAHQGGAYEVWAAALHRELGTSHLAPVVGARPGGEALVERLADGRRELGRAVGVLSDLDRGLAEGNRRALPHLAGVEHERLARMERQTMNVGDFLKSNSDRHANQIVADVPEGYVAYLDEGEFGLGDLVGDAAPREPSMRRWIHSEQASGVAVLDMPTVQLLRARLDPRRLATLHRAFVEHAPSVIARDARQTQTLLHLRGTAFRDEQMARADQVLAYGRYAYAPMA